ncbi:MAG TPA: TetR/AcrR family transcriptional regulator [Acidisarcina sp.]|nr:TetR/AcrR family transcriptional regulator [Acidisarcina sp.]
MTKDKIDPCATIEGESKDQPDIRLGALLDIAAEVFVSEGFEAASVGEIARRAKASKQTIYLHYPSKAELFQAVITWRVDATYCRIASLLISDDPPQKALMTFGAGLLDMVLEASAVGLLRLVYMESRRFPQLGELIYNQGAGRGLAKLESYIRKQRDLGRLRVEDTEIAAEQFLDMITGRLLMRAALGVAPNPSQRDKKSRVKAAVDVFLAAYGCEKG